MMMSSSKFCPSAEYVNCENVIKMYILPSLKNLLNVEFVRMEWRQFLKRSLTNVLSTTLL